MQLLLKNKIACQVGGILRHGRDIYHQASSVSSPSHSAADTGAQTTAYFINSKSPQIVGHFCNDEPTLLVPCLRLMDVWRCAALHLHKANKTLTLILLYQCGWIACGCASLPLCCVTRGAPPFCLASASRFCLSLLPLIAVSPHPRIPSSHPPPIRQDHQPLRDVFPPSLQDHRHDLS